MLFLLSGLLQAEHTFAFDKEDMLLDGEKFLMISGEMHPSRIPHQYWRHRIQMAKAMGMNTIAIYVMWNIHEQQEGVFDFMSPQNNITRFIEIAAEEDMWIVIRPGPYICGEWDFGGIPPYLMRDRNLKIRTLTDQNYTDAVKRYFRALVPHFLPQMIYNGGNILMVQIENEYGQWPSSRQEKAYLTWLKGLWIELGVKGPFTNADSSWAYNENVHVDGAAFGLDGGNCGDSDWQKMRTIEKDVPIFVSEIYPGWMRHWGERNWSPTDITKQVQGYLEKSRSFNMYVIHGGTCFGITTGANGGKHVYQPDMTSYDYGSPINESGCAVNNYNKYRDMIFKHLNQTPPAIPDPLPTINTPEIEMRRIASFWDQRFERSTEDEPKWFEYFNQNQGYIVYKTTVPAGKGGVLKFEEIHDYAMVYFDGKYVDTIDTRGISKWQVKLEAAAKDADLEIFVEGMGHKNYAIEMEVDRKGIYDQVTLDGEPLTGKWEHLRLPVELNKFYDNLVMKDTMPDRKGGVYQGWFTITEVGDTFVSFEGYEKGMVWINGQNIGRYWSIGPQKCLFVPSTFLKVGENEILVLENVANKPTPVRGCKACGHCE